jgi:thioesterase domain-containing protein
MELSKNYEKELLSSIPVVGSMNISIEEVGDDFILLKAPLDTNINYEGTAFGGSLNTACILSSYLMVHHALRNNGIAFESLVIQNSSVEYLKPVRKDFFAKAFLGERNRQHLFRLLEKRGRGRVEIESSIFTDDENEKLVTFTGRFVVGR